MRQQSCAHSVYLLTLAGFLTSFCSPAMAESVYVPGQWYDQDKYNDQGIGRTENYWCVLGQDSQGNYFLSNEWIPSLAWSDNVAFDTNRNYAVDPGEVWDKFAWVETGLLSGYYWCDLDHSGGLSDGDPVFAGTSGLNYFTLDGNANRIEDPWENWHLWQVHDDNSCWAAAGSNVMQYIDGSSRYHESMYVQGVEYIDLAGDDVHYWTDGGWPHKMIDAWPGFAESNHDTGLTQTILWDENPIPGIKAILELGIPVALGVQWEGGGAHAFTVYGIDTDAHTLLIADSDSDRDDKQFYEIGYNWIEGAVGNGNLQIDWRGNGSWNADYITDYTSLESSTTPLFGGDLGWFEGAFNKGTGQYAVVSLGNSQLEPVTTVHLRPYQEELTEYTDAQAGRVILHKNSTLEAEPSTKLSMKSMAIKQGGRFLLEGSVVDVDHELVCDGTMDVTDGIANIRYLTVGTSTPGTVNQSGGIVELGRLQLGWDALAQGGLTIAQGSFTSTAEGTYKLLDGILTADLEHIGSQGTGTFNQSGGINHIDWQIVLGDREGTTGTYNLTAGTLRSAATFDDSRMIVGNHGTGTLNISGTGALESQGAFYAGYWNSSQTSSVNLSGDATFLAHGDEMIGYMGDASFVQNTTAAGGHTVEGTLQIAAGEFSHAEYLLESGRLTANSEVIGGQGTASFTQLGGSHEVGNLTLARMVGSTADYMMTGGTLEATYNLYAGKSGEAVFRQDSANVTVGRNLELGVDATGTGDYELLSDTALAINGDEIVGGLGSGSFAQMGGTHSVAGQLAIGKEAGSTGEFRLQDGSLSSFVMELGGYGTGTFTQDGGENNVAIELGLGKHIGGQGTYSLSGGTLSTRTTVVGSEGTGKLTQYDGLHQVSDALTIGYHQDANGTYRIFGGTLDVRNGTIYVARNGLATGQLSLSGGTVWADAIDAIGDAAGIQFTGGVLHVNNMNLSRYASQDITLDALYIGHESSSSDAAVLLGTGVNLNVNDLIVGDEPDKYTSLSIDNGSSPYTIAAGNIYFGNDERSSGSLTLNRLGTVTADYEYVGFWGNGSVTQSRGTNTASQALYLGFWPGSDGSYNLSGGTLQTGDAMVGVTGEGSFHQSGGDADITGTLYIGFGTEADGRYTLEGGTLNTPKIDISKNGGYGVLMIPEGSAQLETDEITVHTDGWLNCQRDFFWDGDMQVDGGNVILNNNSLVLHDGGRIEMSAGNVLADHFVLGSAMPASSGSRFSYYVQTGGHMQVAHDVDIGSSITQFGDFSLSGDDSTVSAERFFVGQATSGHMHHDGGTLTAGQAVAVGATEGGTGIYGFHGGSIHTPLLEIGGEGSGQFNWTGGNLYAGEVVVNTNGTVNVDVDWAATGAVTVAGGDLEIENNTLSIYQQSPGNRGLTVTAGTLTADQIRLTSLDSPAMLHSGGTVEANRVVLDSIDFMTPTYELSAAGALDTSILDLDFGIFRQAGGTTHVTSSVLTDGRFVLEDGALTSQTFYAGYRNYGEYSQSGGQADIGSLIVTGNTAHQGDAWLGGDGILNTHSTRVGVTGTGWFEQDGGTHAITGDLSIGEVEQPDEEAGGARYWLKSGSLTSRRTYVGRMNGGSFIQDGGSHVIAESLNIASGAVEAWGYYSMRGGTLQVPTVNIGSDQNDGVFAYYGGTVEAETINIAAQGTLDLEGNWSKSGGDININGGTLMSNSYEMSVIGGDVTMHGGWLYGRKFSLESTETATSTLRGYGYVMEEGYGFSTEFINNGKVIADGCGASRALDMSDVRLVTNSQENPGDWGWYAENGGELKFPDQKVSTNKWLYSWGDVSTDWEPDLVNSVQLYLYDFLITGTDRTFSASLLAPDHPSIPDGLHGILGVWDLSAPAGLSVYEAGMLFRYDYDLVNRMNWLEDGLRLFHYNGQMWEDVTGGVDAAMHYIYSADITSFSMYAIAIPEPATASLMFIGLLGLLGHRQRRS